ncbi:PREDICTED: probable cytochrome P450 4ac1 [Polistes dominula]|uniref:Probable cytochrome P450 4ac1 n=1 Tax=Polistes dominula TaxID=743375 RepID=A0ABM1I4U3_POLDO|nr:PREDICTED: probable cytochrome P450 4ac1 [Polistes dominula]
MCNYVSSKVNENLVIPKDCYVLISIIGLHRKEKNWKNPLTFDPDRFLPGNFDKKYFLPFSRGIRNCIGQDFAMLKIKIIAATILRKFTLHTDYAVSIEDIKLKFGITSHPAEPIILRFCKR